MYKELILNDLSKVEAMAQTIYRKLLDANNVEPIVLAKISTARDALKIALREVEK